MDLTSVSHLKDPEQVPVVRPGDTVRVHFHIEEGGRGRTQVFQGVVIRRRRGGAGASFTVRRVFQGIGVERTFPFHSPHVQQVEVVRRGVVRRSRLYYLRGLSGRAARIKERVSPRRS